MNHLYIFHDTQLVKWLLLSRCNLTFTNVYNVHYSVYLCSQFDHSFFLLSLLMILLPPTTERLNKFDKVVMVTLLTYFIANYNFIPWLLINYHLINKRYEFTVTCLRFLQFDVVFFLSINVYQGPSTPNDLK